MKQKKARVTKVAPEAMAVLVKYDWPGNVRELENVIYRSAVVTQGDAILVSNLPPELRGTTEAGAAASDLTVEKALTFVFEAFAGQDAPLLPRVEAELIARMMKREPDEAVAAKKLGLTKAALQKRLG